MKEAHLFLPGRLLSVLLTLFLLMMARVGQAQQATWAQLIDTHAVLASHQVTDSAGTTTLALEFADSLKVGGYRLTTTGALDIDLAIVQLSAQGKVRWVQQLGSLGRDGLGGLAVDRFGYVYVSGNNEYNFRAGTQVLAPAGAFLVTLNYSGTVVSARTLWRQKAASTLFLTSMVVDTSGICYLTGAATNVDSLGTAAMPTGARRYSFMAAIVLGGPTQWVLPMRSVGWGGAQSTLLDLKISPTGDLLTAGYFRGELLIDHATPIHFPQISTSSRALVVAVRPNGQPRWAKASTSGGAAGAYALGVGPSGEVYLTGNASADSVRFGATAVANRGTFLFRFASSGAVVWGRGASQPGNHSGTGLVVDDAGNATVVGTLFNRAVTFDQVTLTDYSPNAGQPLSSQLFVVSYTPAGEVRWGKIQQQHTLSVTSGYSIGADARGYLYVTGSGNGRYDEADVHGSFLLRIRPTAHLLGMVYLDSNSNGHQDANETHFPQSLILQTTSLADLTVADATNGHFDLQTTPGNVEVRLPKLPAHYYLTEGVNGYRRYLPDAGAVDSLLRFGLAPTPNQPDLQVVFSAYADPRPGFITRSRLTLTNVGTTTIPSDRIYAYLDSRAAYVSSAPVATVAGSQLSWTYPALLPWAQRSYEMQFSLPVNVPIGTALHTWARVPLANDVIPTDNQDSLRQQVTALASPNTLEVSHPRLTLAQVSSGQPIDYTFRFQNIGSDTATNVIIRDTLDPLMFQLTTVRFIGAQQGCRWSLSSAGVLVVRFTDVDLPPRNIDILRSQGFARFRLIPWGTLTDGTIIPNRANIYFDLNPPLATNTVTTIIGNAHGVGLPESDEASTTWTLSPNPADGSTVTLTARLRTAGRVEIAVLDLLGRSVGRRQVVEAPTGLLRHRLEVGALPAGAYIVRLTTPTGATTSRRLLIPE
jgi:uncharacterized repeat protein (TIGR01451 family)